MMRTQELTQSNSLASRGLKSVALLAQSRSHGDRLRYLSGCRCDDCRRANTSYEKARSAARKAGDWNGIVPAKNARTHLIKLSRQGVGRRAVQAVTDIADSVLFDIRAGKKKNIRARTERLILAVTKEQAADHAFVSAIPTWKLLNKLLENGYTKTQLAQALGGKSRALQVGKDQVTVLMAYKVRRLFEKLEKSRFADAAKRSPVIDLPSNTFSPRPGVMVHRLEG
jgi:hypothetical protein